MDVVSCKCCGLSGRGLCDKLITRPEESYRLWSGVVCDLETSRMRRPRPALGRNTIKKKWFIVSSVRHNPFTVSTNPFTECTVMIWNNDLKIITYHMVKQVLAMTSHNSQTRLNPGKHIVKNDLKSLSINSPYWTVDHLVNLNICVVYTAVFIQITAEKQYQIHRDINNSATIHHYTITLVM